MDMNNEVCSFITGRTKIISNHNSTKCEVRLHISKHICCYVTY